MTHLQTFFAVVMGLAISVLAGVLPKPVAGDAIMVGVVLACHWWSNRK